MEEFKGTIINKEKFNNTDIFYDRVIETKENIEKLKQKYLNDYVKHIHCNGCYKKCVITNSCCGRGNSAYKYFATK